MSRDHLSQPQNAKQWKLPLKFAGFPNHSPLLTMDCAKKLDALKSASVLLKNPVLILRLGMHFLVLESCIVGNLYVFEA